MKLPVIIPAHNEEALLPRALAALPADLVEPIVIPNGCGDRTEMIAREAGATVLSLPEASKMRAIQAGIHFLGCRAMEPMLLLDADSHPIFPRFWPGAMVRATRLIDAPAITVGPVVLRGGPGLAANMARSAFRYTQQYRNRTNPEGGSFGGANTAFHLKKKDVVDAILGLDDYWPGEDEAIKDVIMGSGGSSYKSPSPLAGVASDADRQLGLRERILIGRQGATESFTESYAKDCPQGAIPYLRGNKPPKPVSSQL
jgi:glycosyltransferase involved in cell wall biosynthesis